MKKSMENSPVTRREFMETTARTAAALTVAGAVAPLAGGCSLAKTRVAGDGAVDLVIKNGLVYDGTGSEPKKADIAIQGERIAAVGKVNGAGARVIDASGRMVTPGFIDVHTHCDLTFKRTGWKRHLSRVMASWKGNHNYLYQGVTTVVTGNCGYGYTDTDRWLDMVDAVGFGTHVAHLIPHGILREDLFGKETQPKGLSAAQLERMKARVTEEMEKGAFGLSSGLEYAPGCHADTAELVALARVVRRHNGLFASHIRDESGKTGENGRPGIINSLEEAIAVGREAELPVEISHLKISAPINGVPANWLLDTIENARDQGISVLADQYPYAAGSTVLTFLLPIDMVTAGGVKEEFRTRAGRKQVETAVEKVFEYAGPEKIMITRYPAREEYEGKTLARIAGMEGLPAAKSFSAMACDGEPPVAVFFFQDMDVVKALAPHDYIITASDGWTNPKGMGKPHPRVYGTFPRKLRRFILEEKLMALPAAIRSMTSMPADHFHIKDRGRIKAGHFADIAVIDPERIGDHATYADPHQNSTGIDYLLVNGAVAIENGAATGKRNGQPLRRA